MVFQQGRRESVNRGVPSGVRRRETDDRERRWKPFSTSDHSTVTLFAKFRG